MYVPTKPRDRALFIGAIDTYKPLAARSYEELDVLASDLRSAADKVEHLAERMHPDNVGDDVLGTEHAEDYYWSLEHEAACPRDVRAKIPTTPGGSRLGYIDVCAACWERTWKDHPGAVLAPFQPKARRSSPLPA